jgi:hypothetical protein
MLPSRVSVEQIERETSCSVSSVRRAIRALVALGILSRHGPDEFVIHVDILEAMPKVGDGAFSASGRDDSLSGQRTARAIGRPVGGEPLTMPRKSWRPPPKTWWSFTIDGPQLRRTRALVEGAVTMRAEMARAIGLAKMCVMWSRVDRLTVLLARDERRI